MTPGSIATKVARKTQSSSATMSLEQEGCEFAMLCADGCNCQALTKTCQSTFNICFQILKARLILPIMSFLRVGKMTEK
jgi:hypothetical protein